VRGIIGALAAPFEDGTREGGETGTGSVVVDPYVEGGFEKVEQHVLAFGDIRRVGYASFFTQEIPIDFLDQIE
jgi:hypothetical protein